MLNYWASWCEPCREESPLLERWHKRISKRNGTVLGVDVLDVTSDAQDFIAEYGLTYPHLRDKDGVDAGGLRDRGAYPETFVIDREGRIAASGAGRWTRNSCATTSLPLLREN